MQKSQEGKGNEVEEFKEQRKREHVIEYEKKRKERDGQEVLDSK